MLDNARISYHLKKYLFMQVRLVIDRDVSSPLLPQLVTAFLHPHLPLSYITDLLQQCINLYEIFRDMSSRLAIIVQWSARPLLVMV